MKDSEAVDDLEKTGDSTEKKKKKKKKKKKDDPTEVVESTEPLVTGPRWPFPGDLLYKHCQYAMGILNSFLQLWEPQKYRTTTRSASSGSRKYLA